MGLVMMTPDTLTQLLVARWSNASKISPLSFISIVLSFCYVALLLAPDTKFE